MRALELSHPGLTERLILDPGTALAETGVEDVPALFWTGAAWAGAINTAKDDMDLVADLAVANSLLQRALVLDPDWNDGSIHEVLIALEAARSGGNGGSIERAREHFAEAVRLGDGKIAGPYVTLAESVSIKEQKLGEFQELLAAALAVDPEAAPDQRLANVLSRKRAAWLKEHTEDFFIDYEPEEEDAP
jgi:predicted anti-sigma-YlaC factor YlaD